MFEVVSIHASVKDATPNRIQIKHHLRSFNPRICKRCDVFLVLRLVALFGFNPRICKRCDITYFSSCCTPISFNPRICKRCDLLIGSRLLEALRFNPRICKRCDKRVGPKSQTACICVSIHASVKDATKVMLQAAPEYRFQSTHL